MISQTSQRCSWAKRNVGGSVHTAMDLNPIDFGSLEKGYRFNVVAKIIFFDASHESHVLQDLYTGKRFGYRGLLELGYASHTIFAAEFLKQYPFPKAVACDQTRVLNHEILKGVIDVCSGIGALAEGNLAADFEPAISVDINEKMSNLCGKSASSETYQGNIGDVSTICHICDIPGYATTQGARTLDRHV